MTTVALILWILTAAGGLTMAGIWLARRGPAHHRDGTSRISPQRVGLHFTLAAGGLLLWLTYAVTDNHLAGWLAFALLPIVAAIGLLMFMTWLAGRGAAALPGHAADRHIPPLIVAAHGVAAVATLIAVLVALLT